MTDKQALFQAILADPWDKAAPMVYADALEEAGEVERAALHREPFGVPLGVTPRSREYRRRLDRVRESIGDLIPKSHFLYLANGHDLRAGTTLTVAIGDAAWNVSPRDVCVVVRHGMVTEIGCSQSLFIRIARRLFQRQPIRDVRLSEARPEDAFPAPRGARFEFWRSWRKKPKSGRRYTGDLLAHSIYERLQPGETLRGVHNPGDNMGYPSILSAFQALSAACVRHGRVAAGLPVLG